MRIAFGISLFLTIALAVTPALAEGSEQVDLYHYTPEQFAERVLSYTMVTTGSVTVGAGASSSQTVAVDLRAELDVTFGSVGPDGSLPFMVRVSEATSTGLGDAGRTLSMLELPGRLGPDGSLISVETPKTLADLGLTMRELLAGLVVPAPSAPVNVGSQWSVRQQNVEAQRVRSMTLTATYTAQGPKPWANRILPSVTARFRGEGSLREGATRSQIQEIGHGLYYLQPGTGITDLSSVSLVTTVDTVQSGAPASQTRITLTTTLELRGVSEAPRPSIPSPGPGAGAAAPTPAEPAGEEKPETAGEPLPSESEPSSLPEEFVTYRDPAGRFSVALPSPWLAEPKGVTLRRTDFERGDGAGSLNVAVMPLPSPAASAEAIARSALATYQETQEGFNVIEQPTAATLDGEAASQALYRYRTGEGRIATELALFARKGERAIYFQYTAFDRLDLRSLKEEFALLASGFRFGPTPEGFVPADALQLITYVDRDHRFSLLVPSLWPLTERTDDGSSTTFTEVGENGYLSIFAQPGARGVAAHQIVSAWKEQSASDPGFRLLLDVTPSPLGQADGVRVDYEWSGGGGKSWVRRLHGAVVGDTFYAVVLDYVKSGYEVRADVFDAMIESFALIDPEPEPGSEDAPATPSELPAATPPQPATASEPAAAGPASPEAVTPPAPIAPVESSAPAPAVQRPVPEGGSLPGYPFEEPVGSDTVLLLGRFLMRYPTATGRMIEEWGGGLDVYVTAGGREYKATTDPQGYFYIANLPRLSEGRFYAVERIHGTMLGVSQATVTFNNLETGVTSPRVAHLGKVILTRDATYEVDVSVVNTFSSAEDSALDRFLTAYPDSRWTEFVREAIAVARSR